jgi:hypothetical protein
MSFRKQQVKQDIIRQRCSGSTSTAISTRSSRRAVWSASTRKIELIWLTGRLKPDFKTIADFHRDNGTAIRSVCRRFVALCRDMHLFDHVSVAIDGSKFKSINASEKNSFDFLWSSTLGMRCGILYPYRESHGSPKKRNSIKTLKFQKLYFFVKTTCLHFA